MGIHCTSCTCTPATLDETPWSQHPPTILFRGSPAERPSCPAWHDVGDEVLTCLLDPHHDGPHETWFHPPCWSCFGFEMHTDWCPGMDATTDAPGITVAFTAEYPTDNPTYWVQVPA